MEHLRECCVLAYQKALSSIPVTLVIAGNLWIIKIVKDTCKKCSFHSSALHPDQTL